MKLYILIAVGFLIFTGCSSKRIAMIEEEYGIALPENYEVFKNTTESSGFAGADFEVNIELRFQVKEFQELKKELLKIDSLRIEGESRYHKNNTNESSFLEIDEENCLLSFRFNHI